MTLSALDGTGLAEAWEAVARLFDWRREAGHLERVRGEQRLRWFEEELVAQALARLHADPRLMAALPGLRAEVEAGRLAASEAARRALGA